MRQSLLNTAIAGLAELASEDDSFAPDLGRAVAHLKLGEVYRQVGRVPEARKEFERSIELARKLRSATPHDPSVLECLSRGLGYYGYSVLLETALAMRSLARGCCEDRRRNRRRGTLSRRHSRAPHQFIPAAGTRSPLGATTSPTRAAYRRAHELTSTWVADEPGSHLANLYLAHSYIKLGDVEDLAGQVAESRNYFNEAINLCRARLPADRDESNKFTLQSALNNLARLETAQHQMQRHAACGKSQARSWWVLPRPIPTTLTSSSG